MFKNPFLPKGRIRRLEYGLTCIIVVVLNQILTVVTMSDGNPGSMFLILMIPILWFAFAQGAKRCHDVGHNGFWQLIPFYGLWLLFQDGQPGSDEYGRNPKTPMNPNDIAVEPA